MEHVDPSRRVVCPHCQHQFNSDEMGFVQSAEGYGLYDMAHAEDRDVVECPVCDKQFWVQGGWVPEFRSAFAEEEIDNG